MRIVAGSHKGRRLEAPAGLSVRPTADRVRESLFNRLQHGGFAAGCGDVVQDAVVLDAFCGTGALALEALSRGARAAVLMDVAASSLACARRNVQLLGEDGRVQVMRADALRPPPASAAADLVFLDPPYGRDLAAPAIAALDARGWMSLEAVAAIEMGRDEALEDPDGWQRLTDVVYGTTRLLILGRRT